MENESMTKEEINKFLQNQKELGVEELEAFKSLMYILGVANPYDLKNKEDNYNCN